MLFSATLCVQTRGDRVDVLFWALYFLLQPWRDSGFNSVLTFACPILICLFVVVC